MSPGHAASLRSLPFRDDGFHRGVIPETEAKRRLSRTHSVTAKGSIPALMGLFPF